MSKRLLDIALSFTGLIFLLPVMSIIAFLIWLQLGRPVLFLQMRPGLYGKPFTMFKFRTMADIRDSRGKIMPDAERLTRLGRFLRAASLDELPELWNVLKGDMSLVGPRPLLVEYLERYTPQQARRHEIKPGVTGWAQINGRNSLSWEEKFNLDLWYIDNRNFGLDIKILLLTLVGVIRSEGISAHESDTMPEFRGAKIEGDKMEFFSDKRPANLNASNSFQDEKLPREEM